MKKMKTYSWEELENRRSQLRKEVKEKEMAVKEKIDTIFAAPTPEDKMEQAINYAKSAYSAYDGFMTGYKLLKTLGLVRKIRTKKEKNKKK